MGDTEMQDAEQLAAASASLSLLLMFSPLSPRLAKGNKGTRQTRSAPYIVLGLTWFTLCLSNDHSSERCGNT